MRKPPKSRNENLSGSLRKSGRVLCQEAYRSYESSGNIHIEKP